MASFNAGYGGAQRQRSLAGATPTGENAPGKFPIGTELWDDSALGAGGQKFWRVQLNTAGTAKIWVQISGTGAPGSSAWGKYVVSEQTTPLALYTTIEAGVAAAVADLHAAADPAVVLVMPGDYAPAGGRVTLSPGISLCAFTQNTGGGAYLYTPCDTRVTGGLRINGTASVHVVSGIAFATTGAISALELTGANDIDLRVQGCSFYSAAVPAALLTNTGSNSSAYFERCELESTDELAASVVTVGMVAGALVGAQFRNCLISPVALNLPCFAVTAEAQVTVFDCLVYGTHTVAAAAFFTAVGSNIQSTVAPLFALAAASSAVVIDGGSTGCPGAWTSGAGSITIAHPTESSVSAPGQRKAAATVSYSTPRLQQEFIGVVPSVVWGGASPYTYPDGVDVLQVATAGADVIVTLRALNTYFNGEKITVKSMSATGAIAVTPASVADTIDGLAAGAAYSIMPGVVGYGWVTLESVNTPTDGAGTTLIVKWMVVSAGGGLLNYQRPWRLLTDAPGSILATNRGLLVPLLTAARTYTLPSVITFPDGEFLEIKRVVANANDFIMTPFAGNNIDGATTSVNMDDGAVIGWLTLRADAARLAWRIVSSGGTYVLT